VIAKYVESLLAAGTAGQGGSEEVSS
jgi:hypothetical protein